MGPPVPIDAERWRRWSAAALILGPLQFVAEMLVEQALWPGYSAVSNYISDLGAPPNSFGDISNGTPYWWVFSLSLGTLAVSVLVGIVGLRRHLPGERAAVVVTIALALLAVGSMGVAIFNEVYYRHVHVPSAVVGFVDGAIALLVFGYAARDDPRWRSLALPSFLGGALSVASMLLLAAPTLHDGPIPVVQALWPGGWERLIVLPPIVWSIAVGSRLLSLTDPERPPRTGEGAVETTTAG